MSRLRKVLDQILRGNSDATIDFGDLCKLLDVMRFRDGSAAAIIFLLVRE